MTNTGLVLLLFAAVRAGAQPVAVAPRTMPRTGAIDQRFQSYNIEMVEVTGGRFWKPYAAPAQASAPKPDGAVAGLPADLLEYRPPIDLSNTRLRKLAAALGPAYVRVSGTWANTIFFHDSDDPAPEKPPAGFNAILTRKQWKGVIDFVHAVEGRLITSFAFGAGNRDAAGAWTPDQARHVLAYTKTAGGNIAAAEFMNEPNYAAQGGAIRGYGAAAYGRDIETFRRFFREAAPGSLFLGPGSTGEGGVLGRMPTPGKLQTEDLLKATGPAFDVFSYHIYTAVSQRCAGAMPSIGTTAAAARSASQLLGSLVVAPPHGKCRPQSPKPIRGRPLPLRPLPGGSSRWGDCPRHQCRDNRSRTRRAHAWRALHALCRAAR